MIFLKSSFEKVAVRIFLKISFEKVVVRKTKARLVTQVVFEKLLSLRVVPTCHVHSIFSIFFSILPLMSMLAADDDDFARATC